MEIIDIGKKIIQAIQESDNIVANTLIIEFQGMALEMQADNYELRKQIDQLNQQLTEQGKMTYDEGTGLYNKKDDDVPLCPRCWEQDGKALHMIKGDPEFGQFRTCPQCEYHYDFTRNL